MPRSRLVLLVYLPTALLAFGQGLLLAILPLHAARFGVSYTWVSLAVSAAALGTLITDVPAGALLGRIGLRRAMTIGAGTVAVTTFALGMPLGGGFATLVALRLAAGIGTALWGLSRHAFIAEAVPPSERGRAISVFGGINRIGVFGGPAIGGLVAGAFGLRAPFLLSGLMAGAAFALAVVAIRPGPSAAAAMPAATRWRVVGQLLRTNGRDLTAASVAQTFAQMIRAGRQLIVPLYGADRLGLGPAEVGLVMTAGALLDVSMFIPAGLVMDRFGRKVAAVPSFAVMAVGVAMVPLATGYLGLLAASAVIGFGNGMGSGTMMTLGADLAPRGATGEFLGLWRLVGDSGAVAGPLVVGVMAEAIGLNGSAFALGAVGILAALTIAFLVQETRLTPAAADGGTPDRTPARDRPRAAGP